MECSLLLKLLVTLLFSSELKNYYKQFLIFFLLKANKVYIYSIYWMWVFFFFYSFALDLNFTQNHVLSPSSVLQLIVQKKSEKYLFKYVMTMSLYDTKELLH